LSVDGFSVLFVCTANRIRSVMAEALLREQVRDQNALEHWRIGSAGTWAIAGMPPMPKAVDAMAELGIDISGHRSCPVDDAQIGSYALILVMERGHKEALTVEFPEFADRVYLLSEMTGQAYEIGDPITGPTSGYRHTAEMLEEVVKAGFERIRTLAGNGQYAAHK
jgi:protein-tyrosine phosphatase